MCRTIVGVSANLCPVDPKGKPSFLPCLVSCGRESVKQVGFQWSSRWGDPSLVKDYMQTIDKLILSGGQNVELSLYGEEKCIEAMDYNIERDRLELSLLKEAVRQNKTGSRNLPWGSVDQCGFWRNTQPKRSKGIGKDFRLGLPILSRLKKAVWWNNSLVRPVGLILCTAKVSRILHRISVRPP